jgi:hypothetical protein
MRSASLDTMLLAVHDVAENALDDLEDLDGPLAVLARRVRSRGERDLCDLALGAPDVGRLQESKPTESSEDPRRSGGTRSLRPRAATRLSDRCGREPRRETAGRTILGGADLAASSLRRPRPGRMRRAIGRCQEPGPLRHRSTRDCRPRRSPSWMREHSADREQRPRHQRSYSSQPEARPCVDPDPSCRPFS